MSGLRRAVVAAALVAASGFAWVAPSADATCLATPTQLYFKTQPTSGPAGQAMHVVVGGITACGAHVFIDGYPHLSLVGEPRASLVGETTKFGGTFNDFAVPTTGAFRLVATDTGVRPGVSIPFTVVAPVATHIQVVSGDAAGLAGTPLNNPIAVQVTDSLDEPVSDAIVSFEASSGDGVVDIPYGRTNAAGGATATSWNLGPHTGTNVLRSTVAEFSTEATVAALPAPDTWQAAGFLRQNDAFPSSTLLPDGRVLLTPELEMWGTNAELQLAGRTPDMYDPGTNRWLRVQPMHEQHYEAVTVALKDGRVLVAGGYQRMNVGGNAPVPDAEIFDPSTGSWTRTGRMPAPAQGGPAVTLKDGRVLLIYHGSRSAGGDQALIYNPRTNAWTQGATMHTFHSRSTATRLPSGNVLVAGGEVYGQAGSIATSEIYNVRTGRWFLTRPMNHPRKDASAILLRDGNVLVAGGMDNSSFFALTHAELFNPLTQTWTDVASASSSHEDGGLTMLLDGRVLFAGGDDGLDPTTKADIYDPLTNSWLPAAALDLYGVGPGSTLLKNGKVLMFGFKPRSADPEDLWAYAALYQP